jgi:hypothetical protein
MVQGADVNSVWNGSVGAWTEPANWTHSSTNFGADFPANDILTYAVTIPSGQVVLSQSVTIDDFTISGGVLINESILTVTNAFTWYDGILAGSGVYSTPGISVYGPVTNDAWLRLSGNSHSELYSVHHRGTIDIGENGGASLYDSVSSGRFLLASNTAVHFGGGTNHLAPGTAIVGHGRVSWERALIIDGTVTNTCALETQPPFTLIDGPGNLVLTDNATMFLRNTHLLGTGKIEAGPNTRITFTGTSFSWLNRTLENHGTLLVSNVFVSGHSWTLHNHGELAFYYDDFLRPDNHVRSSPGGSVPVIVNHGLLAATNVWWGTVDLGVNITNYGDIVADWFSLRVRDFVNFADTRLDCAIEAHTFHNRAGTLSLPWGVRGALTNDAVIHILTTNQFAGWIDGPFHQSSNAVLRLDLTTAELGTNTALRVIGAAFFDGTLDVRLQSDVQPTVGQRFHAITFGSSQGLFARVQGLNIGNGLRLAPIITSNSLDLLVVNAANPSTPALHIERDETTLTLHVAPEFQGYFLQSTTNLVSGAWETLTFAPSAIVLPIDPARPQRFFRLRDPACCE